MNQIKIILNKIIDFFSILFISSITILILLQILLRFLDVQVIWTSELVRFIFVFLIFFGSALAINEKEHIVVESLIDKFPKKVQIFVYIFVQMLILVFLFIFIIGNLNLVESTSGSTLISMQWFKMSYLYTGIIIASILMIFYTIIEIVDKLSEVFLNKGRNP